MGTPHVGSDLAKWAHIFVNLSSILRKTNKEIIRVLEPGSEMLAALQQEFHTMLDARQKSEKKVIKIFCFYEELAVSGVGEVCRVTRTIGLGRKVKGKERALTNGRLFPSILRF